MSFIERNIQIMKENINLLEKMSPIDDSRAYKSSTIS
jgi:hypothetical protein